MFLRRLPMSAASLAFAFTTQSPVQYMGITFGYFCSLSCSMTHMANGASQGNLWFPVSHTRQVRSWSRVEFAAPKPGLLSPTRALHSVRLRATFLRCGLGLQIPPHHTGPCVRLIPVHVIHQSTPLCISDKNIWVMGRKTISLALLSSFSRLSDCTAAMVNQSHSEVLLRKCWEPRKGRE